MNVIAAADGAELALGEKAGQREWAAQFLNHTRVVIGTGKEPRAATVATEEEGPSRTAGVLLAVGRQQMPEVFISGIRIANMKLHQSDRRGRNCRWRWLPTRGHLAPPSTFLRSKSRPSRTEGLRARP